MLWNFIQIYLTLGYKDTLRAHCNYFHESRVTKTLLKKASSFSKIKKYLFHYGSFLEEGCDWELGNNLLGSSQSVEHIVVFGNWLLESGKTCLISVINFSQQAIVCVGFLLLLFFRLDLGIVLLLEGRKSLKKNGADQ